ncbi:MAG: VacJ family lipoprotein [Alphaproteobacteria bacterium]|nr:VacJ family lipoprotein [Alphaproteobacteria bacterium]
MRAFLRLLPVLFAVLPGGCATAPPSAEALAANDPFEATNRETLKLNGRIDRFLLTPIDNLYHGALPRGGSQIVHNVVHNVSSPTTLANDLLQGEMKRAAETFARLVINSTFGLGGMFDPAASHFHIPPHDEDFGETLGVWGVGEGPYLVVPVLGPLPPRDAFGMAADVALNPVNYIHFNGHAWWEAGRYTAQLIDAHSRTYEDVRDIERSSIDNYAALRSMYRQKRNNEIRNGRPEVQNLPQF